MTRIQYVTPNCEQILFEPGCAVLQGSSAQTDKNIGSLDDNELGDLYEDF